MTTRVVRLKLFRLNQASLPASVYASSYALTRRPGKELKCSKEYGKRPQVQRFRVAFLSTLLIGQQVLFLIRDYEFLPGFRFVLRIVNL